MTAHRRLRAWIRLSLDRSVGAAVWNRWLVELEAAGLCLEEFFDLPEYRARPFLSNQPIVARALHREAPSRDSLDHIVARLEREHVRLIAISDSNYPERLLNRLGYDAPTFLYARGRLGRWRSPTVAMIGTRRPSPQGIESARAYAGALAREGVHVVSGHARGIDVASHEGALGAGGSTTLVLPRGILAFQPAPALRGLITRDNTLIVSQFAPEAAVGPDLPILRNTTLAALSDGLILVESGLRGGASYAFREARRLREPLWTVIYPEPVPPSAAGNHSLLSAGAEPLEPGLAGAERCAAEIAKRLRAARAHRPASAAAWPPRDRSGQQELF
jgi:DNA processing protein